MLLTKQLLHTTDSFIKRLNATGISTVQDFVQWYPRAYEDKSKLHTIFSLMDIRDKCAVRATIETITTEKTRSHKILSKAILRDEKDYFAEAVWFNSPYFLKQYKA
jgi:ATP-dependent DNA helicase RecG